MKYNLRRRWVIIYFHYSTAYCFHSESPVKNSNFIFISPLYNIKKTPLILKIRGVTMPSYFLKMSSCSISSIFAALSISAALSLSSTLMIT